jgi:hypothetical protein
MSVQLGSAKRSRMLSMTSVGVIVPSKSHTICQCIICGCLFCLGEEQGDQLAELLVTGLEQGLCQPLESPMGRALGGVRGEKPGCAATNFVACYKQHQCLHSAADPGIDARMFAAHETSR